MKNMINTEKPIITAACLLGKNCTYNGRNYFDQYVVALGMEYQLIPVCPHNLGQLFAPSYKKEIQNTTGLDVLLREGIVMDIRGHDITQNLIDGAHKVLKMAQMYGSNTAILKERNASGGCGEIYDGTFSGMLIDGDGVTTALLKDNGIKVYSEGDIKDMMPDHEKQWIKKCIPRYY